MCCHMNSEFQLSEVGFPIQKSSDQSLFAAPQGLSQRTTSFIASQCQGIHRTPLRHLIALMIDAHPSAEVAPVLRRYGASTEEDQLASRFDQGRAVRQQPQWRYAKDQSLSLLRLNDPSWSNRLFTMSDNMPPTPMGQSGKLLPSLAERHPGGARRDRTDDLMLAKHALSQLSYGPSGR